MNKYVWDICEVDNCNAHVGKGGDYHYHGDPYGSHCLYSAAAEESNHPSLYGYSLDGIPIHGRYTKESQDSQALPLDRCGGHSHGSYGYHYHSEVDTSGSFVKYMQGPSGCWKGDITKIANFWDNSGRQANYDNAKSPSRYVVSQRSDYESLRPCCGSADYYVTGEVKLNLLENTAVAVESSAQAPMSQASPANPSGSMISPNSPSASNVISYSFTTINVNSYMCKQKGISVINANLACAQADSGETAGNGINVLKCANDGVIQCFAFASLGKIGGSCNGDEFKEDGDLGKDVAYLPVEVAQGALGKSSVSFSLTQTTVNGVVSGFPSQGPTPKLKVLAMCSSAQQSSAAAVIPATGTAAGNLKNSAHYAKVKSGFLFQIVFVLLLSVICF